MLGKTHALAGALAGAGVAALSGTRGPAALGLMFAGGVGALLPDLDHQGSKASRACRALAPLVGVGVCVWWTKVHGFGGGYESRALAVGALTMALVFFFPLVVSKSLGHRGPTHSLALWLGLSALALRLLPAPVGPVLAALAAGAGLGGCVPDALTISGSPLLWPFYREPVNLLPADLRYRTGGWAEALTFRPLLAATAAYVFYLNLR